VQYKNLINDFFKNHVSCIFLEKLTYEVGKNLWEWQSFVPGKQFDLYVSKTHKSLILSILKYWGKIKKFLNQEILLLMQG